LVGSDEKKHVPGAAAGAGAASSFTGVFFFLIFLGVFVFLVLSSGIEAKVGVADDDAVVAAGVSSA
jgi:hypothetical protein